MNTPKTSLIDASARVRKTSIIAMIIGLVAFIVAIGLDARGFGGGLILGAAVGAVVVGGYFWGYANGLRRGGDERVSWLPSQDAQE